MFLQQTTSYQLNSNSKTLKFLEKDCVSFVMDKMTVNFAFYTIFDWLKVPKMWSVETSPSAAQKKIDKGKEIDLLERHFMD